MPRPSWMGRTREKPAPKPLPGSLCRFSEEWATRAARWRQFHNLPADVSWLGPDADPLKEPPAEWEAPHVS
jgi:hypothetical protein